MSLVINTNIMSITAQRNLAANEGSLSISVQRLSSGLRINSAKDDAAGLAISEKLTAHVKSISVAIRNSQDGISLSQATEGGLVEMGNILKRMRELSTQAATGTIEDRTALQSEFTQLQDEMNRISAVTEFNGIQLLNGESSSTGVTLQVGFQNTTNDKITFYSGVGATNTSALGVSAVAVSAAAEATTAIQAIDSAIAAVASRRGTFGAINNRLASTVANLRVEMENLSAANSRIKDADLAYETAEFTKNQILVQAATAILA
ncbi:MAG: flagellin FliC [Nitrospirae bacterium]|nr:flagellin FliC [Nitrospirota bacterium]